MGMCQTSAGVTVKDQPESVLWISRNYVKDQVTLNAPLRRMRCIRAVRRRIRTKASECHPVSHPLASHLSATVRSAPVLTHRHSKWGGGLQMKQPTKDDARDLFPTETAGLSEATTPSVLRVRDGNRLDLRIAPVRKTIEGTDVRMLAYNGSIPGPTLHVDQGSEITVQVTNEGPIDTTVHWHGLRLENRYDGVPHETQEPIPVGGTFTYKVQFTDTGFYWYHPHIREDFGQEMGLYGTIVVEPSDASYWPPVDRFLTVTLDDLLIEDGHIAPFRRSGTNFTAMGRFGNVMLINGASELTAEAKAGEVVRLYLVNTANTRIFNVALPGARAKLVGGDSGRYERETFVDEVMLAPSERAVLDVLFQTDGDMRFEHRTPDRVYDLGRFSITGSSPGGAAASFETLRVDPELSAEHESIQHALEREPDQGLAL